jgi:hypothetical protein
VRLEDRGAPALPRPPPTRGLLPAREKKLNPAPYKPMAHESFVALLWRPAFCR